MKLNKTDYVLERTSDGGYYAWLIVRMQCNEDGDSPEEAVINMEQTMESMVEEMNLGEDFVESYHVIRGSEEYY